MLNNFFNDKPKEEVKEPLFEIKTENEDPKPNPFAEIVNKEEEIQTSIEDEPIITSKPRVKMVEKLSGAKYNEINILDLNNITQTYDDGRVRVFENFNLNIKDIIDKGQFVTILGQSGCGKSTILRYIAGIQKPNEGKVLLRGKKLTENDRIPMVFQHYSSFPWYSVMDNVALPLIIKGISKKESRKRAMEMIKIVGLDGHENKYAKYPNLSGGQLQRVAIARNLVANSEILLMDEPFGALDIVTRTSMQVFLRKIFQDNNQIDPTVILVTHDIREAIFLSTDILILDASPANVRCHIGVDLPDVRNTHLKREPKFLEYVNYVEDFMEKLEVESEARKQERKNDVEKTPRKNMFNFLFKK
jgi:NitT/TauT family transport system ATP-binding protein